MREASGRCAAQLAFDLGHWAGLRVLVSCEGADLLIKRVHSDDKARAGTVFAQELKGTPVAEQQAVHAVLSQLAFDELVRGARLW
jgi:hypothetical protein